MLNKELENGGLAFYNVNCLQTVIDNLQTATLPLYKYVKNEFIYSKADVSLIFLFTIEVWALSFSLFFISLLLQV